MSRLFLRIVSIPCQRPGFLADLRANVTAPAKFSNTDSIKKWLEENGETAAREAWLKTAYDGSLGEIIAIAWAFDDGMLRAVHRSLDIPEAALLDEFYSDLQEIPTQIIGHNILGYDLRFLYHRSVICSVRPPFSLYHDNRYNNDRVLDTMQAWAGWNKYLSLPDLARAIGFDAPDSMTAADAWAHVEDGDVDVVEKVCIREVSLVRQVFNAMTFAESSGPEVM